MHYICMVLYSSQRGFHVNYVIRTLQHPRVMEVQNWKVLPNSIVVECGPVGCFPWISCYFMFQVLCLCYSFFLKCPSPSPCIFACKASSSKFNSDIISFRKSSLTAPGSSSISSSPLLCNLHMPP